LKHTFEKHSTSYYQIHTNPHDRALVIAIFQKLHILKFQILKHLGLIMPKTKFVFEKLTLIIHWLSSIDIIYGMDEMLHPDGK
jgi:hypothetical protein